MTTTYWLSYFRNESKLPLRFLIISLLLSSPFLKTEEADIVVAERMLDAFYAFDQQALTAMLEPGEDADKILYYQAWALNKSVLNKSNFNPKIWS